MLIRPHVRHPRVSTSGHEVYHENKLHLPGLNAHHSGCSGIALIPRWAIRNATSCKRGRASVPLRGSPSGSVAPVQNTSAELAARGQTIGSRFAGEDCSVHRSCSPPRTSLVCASVKLARGSKVYDFCHVLKGSHQEFPSGSSPIHSPAPQSR